MELDNITDSDFEKEVLGSKTPVLIDFWAEWCGPCQMLAPVLEELSKDMGSKIRIVKLNVDENPETPSKFGVRGIPTMMIFKDGQQITSKIGIHPKSALADWIDSSI
jgi:thioredoxin 1